MKAVIITPYIKNKIKNIVDIEKDDFIMCADNSFRLAKEENISPDLIIGDFDSGAPCEFPSGTEIIKVPSEKDDTDTMLCIKEAIDRGFSDIVIAGGIGGRLDHTYANIQSLYYGKLHGADVKLTDGENEAFIMLPGKIKLKKRSGAYLSVFSYGEKVAGLCEAGVKYPLSLAELSNAFPLGVSNEITEDTAEISFTDGVLLIILSRAN
ncbi:MAG: thiamine diphosphokinase [Eubacteriales bacterium]